MFESFENSIIPVSVPRIQILPQCSREKYGVLWNYRYFGAELVEAKLTDINVVDKDETACGLN